MPDEHQRDRERAQAIQRGNAVPPFGFVPNCQPADAAHRRDPTPTFSRSTRRGEVPVRFSR